MSRISWASFFHTDTNNHAKTPKLWCPFSIVYYHYSRSQRWICSKVTATCHGMTFFTGRAKCHHSHQKTPLLWTPRLSSPYNSKQSDNYPHPSWAMGFYMYDRVRTQPLNPFVLALPTNNESAPALPGFFNVLTTHFYRIVKVFVILFNGLGLVTQPA